MAVKPLTQPEYWATDAVYTTGPFIGQPQKVVPPSAFAAEGHRPGTNFPTPAEYENSQQHNLTGLARWVFAGSSAGAADAHVVETDSTGMSTLKRLTVNDPANEVAMLLTSSGTMTPAMLVTNTSGGGGIVSQIGNTNGVAVAASLGSGSGFGFYAGMTGTGAGGTGFRVDANAGTAGSGMIINHAGSGVGVEVNVSGTGRGFTVVGGAGDEAIVVTGGVNQGAITAVSGTNGGAAISANGVGTAYGLDATGGLSGSSADGVRGTALNVSAAGVHGRSSSGAGGGSGVLAEGIGAGQVGLYARSTAGYAFLFQGDATPPLYPIGRFVPQNSDPTASTSTGDFTISVQDQFRYCVAGFGYKPFMSMPTNGSAVLGVANLASGSPPVIVNQGGASWNTVLTVSCLASQGNGFYSQLAGNTVKVRFTAEVRTLSLAANVLNLQIVDITGAAFTFGTWTGAGTGATAGFLLPTPDTGWQRTIVAEANRAPASDGNLVIKVEAQRTGAVNMEIRNARLEVLGAF